MNDLQELSTFSHEINNSLTLITDRFSALKKHMIHLPEMTIGTV